MTTQLLDEVRAQPLDTAGLDRLRTLDTQIIGELLTDLTPDLRQELQRLALHLPATPSCPTRNSALPTPN
jgi:hypothetical protein